MIGLMSAVSLYNVHSLTQCPLLSGTLVLDKNEEWNEKFIFGTLEQQLVYVKMYEAF